MIFIYISAEQMVDTELPHKIRRYLYSIIQMGEAVYQDILKYEQLTFKSEFTDSIKSLLQTKVIYRQFDDDFIPSDFPFRCTKVRVNNFNMKIPELSIGNVIVHFAYTYKNGILPSSAKYKERRAIFNRPFDRQLELDIAMKNNDAILDGSNPIREIPYYAIITFGGKTTFDFANLIVPSSGFNDISYSYDLKNEMHIMDKEIESENIVKRRIKLRNDIIVQINKESM